MSAPTTLDGLSRFGIPLMTNIIGDLWQGGVIDGQRLPDDFRYVVSLHPSERYELGANTERFEYELVDVERMPDPALLEEIAASVLEYMTIGKTLVHCQAGLNRSGLIVALAMIRGGWQPIGAITELRHLRSPDVLFNGVFAQWLMSLDGA